MWSTRRARRTIMAALLALLVPPLLVLPPLVLPRPALAEAEAAGPLSAIVHLSTKVPAEARTARGLGTERQGSGVVIDDSGLVLTIGYLVLESSEIELMIGGKRTVSASFVAYDHETGLGLVRANRPLGVKPIPLGNSGGLKRGSPVLAASFGGERAAMGAYVVARREFAGWWEYMLDEAIFTAPAHPVFGGAALVDQQGRLVGIGSLMVPDAAEPGVPLPGNMFVPIDALKPVLGDLIASGRSGKPTRPWLGLYPQALHGRLFVARVPPGGPAAKAGIKPGDLVLGVGGKPVTSLPEYYRALWSLGAAGIDVPLDMLRGNQPTTMKIRSIDRHDWFIVPRSY